MSSQMRRILLIKRKSTTATSPASQQMPSSEILVVPNSDSAPQHLFPAAYTSTNSLLAQQILSSTSVKREVCSPETKGGVKSESRSHSPPRSMASIAPERNTRTPRSSAATETLISPMNSLISAMVDSTKYASAPTRNPSVPQNSKTVDEQAAKKFAVDAAAFPFPTSGGEQGHSSRKSEDVVVLEPAPAPTPKNDTDERHNRQNDAVEAGTVEVAAFPSAAAPESRCQLPRRSPYPSRTSQPRTDQHHSQTPDNPILSNAKPSTPRSLYPGPSATMSSPEPPNTNGTKRSRLARSDHPERYQYAGNTFSNLDDRAFHDTAKNNPYLSQLTADATRPVYKSPIEARHALKEASEAAAAATKPTPTPPLDPSQQLKELSHTIAEFRKKYEKAKVMTTQAGIEIEGNVWDRLSNIVQYPPEIDQYATIGQGDLAKYAEEMKAWDRAIGHQVIIKKRIVYREAIEKLQVKVEILQAERDIDKYHAGLKRKAGDAVAEDREGGA